MNELTTVNQPLLKPHHWRHVISGTIVFLAGICADVIIVDFHHDRAHVIRWQRGEVQSEYHYKRMTLPPANVPVEMGISDDGALVWEVAEVIITKLMDRLEIGDWFAARDLASTRWIVTVAIDSPAIGNQHFKLVDGPGNDPGLFKDAVDAVVYAHQNGRSVLVNCVGGRSRFAAVCVAALSRIKGKTLCEAYDFVIATHAPARIHPHLGKFLLE